MAKRRLPWAEIWQVIGSVKWLMDAARRASTWLIVVFILSGFRGRGMASSPFFHTKGGPESRCIAHLRNTLSRSRMKSPRCRSLLRWAGLWVPRLSSCLVCSSLSAAWCELTRVSRVYPAPLRDCQAPVGGYRCLSVTLSSLLVVSCQVGYQSLGIAKSPAG